MGSWNLHPPPPTQAVMTPALGVNTGEVRKPDSPPGCILACIPGGASACDAGDLGSTPGLGRSPGEGNGDPLQYSCLENHIDGEPSRLHSMVSQRIGHDST